MVDSKGLSGSIDHSYVKKLVMSRTNVCSKGCTRCDENCSAVIAIRGAICGAKTNSQLAKPLINIRKYEYNGALGMRGVGDLFNKYFNGIRRAQLSTHPRWGPKLDSQWSRTLRHESTVLSRQAKGYS
ncbi:MAG: hypothetical protein ACSHX3_01815 [Litorimonas sp.]